MSYHQEVAEWRNKPFTPNQEEFDERQIKLVEMLLDGELTKGEIAEKIGVHRNTVTRWLKDDRIKALIAQGEAEKIRQTNNFFIAKAPVAALKLWEMATKSSDKRVAREIYQYVVDRAIGKPTGKMEVNNTNTEHEDYDINAALQRFSKEDKPAPLMVADAG